MKFFLPFLTIHKLGESFQILKTKVNFYLSSSEHSKKGNPQFILGDPQ